MKLRLDIGFPTVAGFILLMFALAAGAAGPEDNFPPNGQIPPGWATTPGSTTGWAVASDSTNGGAFSLKSGPLPDDPNAPADQRKTASIEVGGSFSAGNINFAYQVSSEAQFDFFEFFIDGQQVLTNSGIVGWTNASFSVAAGNHVFRWVYDKDASVAGGSDAAWIDTVVLPAGTILQQLSVTRIGNGTGTVLSSPAGITCGGICSGYFTTNSTVTLTASPGAGSQFAGWSGGVCTGTSPTCVVTLSAARNVIANFVLADDNFPANGQIPAGWTNSADSNVPWKVATDTTYRGAFSLKSGTILDGQTSAIQVTSTVSAGTVDFAYRVSSEEQYDIFAFYVDDVLQFASSGEIGWTEKSIPVAGGTHVFKFAYFKDAQGQFAGSDAAWIDSVVFPTGVSTRLLTVTGAGTGAGTVSSSPSGISCGATCSAFFATNSTVSLTATPAAGSAFVGWAGACSGATTPCSVVMSAAKDVTATFNVIGQTSVAVAKAGTGSGTVTSNPAGVSCGATCSATFAANSTVTLTATADAGSSFSGWTGDCTVTTPTCTLTMNAAKNVTATFAATTYSLTVIKAGAGASNSTVTSNPAGINCGATCSATFTSGNNVTLTATAGSGFTFSGWSGACSGTGTCVVLIDASKSATATFSTVTNPTSLLSVSLAGTGAGVVTSNPAGINCGATCSATFTTNTSVTLTAAAAAGSVFSGWSGACSGASATCVVVMSANQSVGATFSIPGTSGPLDIDASSPGSKYDALTDGLLFIRYLFGLTGTALTNGAIGATATRTDPAQIKSYLDGVRAQLDIDGNGSADALTDGLLVIRYLFGLRGAALINGAVGAGAQRSTSVAIESYLQSLMP